MPPTTDIGAAIDELMAPFCEHNNENHNAFWDWFIIGGRFTGEKETCGYAEERLDEFYKKLTKHKITVSGLQCGKQKIEPSSQIPLVDKLWNEIFPTENGEIIACPLFAHASNQYDSNDLLSCDICRVEEIPDNLTAGRVIIAGPNYDDDGIRATYMMTNSEWNGVNFTKTDWDGKVKTVLKEFTKYCETFVDTYKQKVLPQPNWICITVDYHS